MTWEEKYEACKNLSSEISLKMRKPGDWYVHHPDVEIKNGGVLSSKYGNGDTPQKAVEDHWKQLTDLDDFEYVVLGAYNKVKRKAYKWNGHMWMKEVEK